MKTTFAGLLCLTLCLTAWAALDSGIVEPIDVQESYARGGDPSAQYNLGIAYSQGKGVEKDLAKAFAWFKAAAERGYPDAQYNLGICYFNGAGVAKDDKAAVRWCSLAARQGMVAAQVMLVRCHLSGTGIEKSPVKALAWDFLARRTLALRKGGDMGTPPAPGRMRTDGAVEQADAGGKKVWVTPDGGRETTDSSGIRVISYADGMRATITPDGTRETKLPSGDIEWKLPDGTQILMNPAGATRAQFPDGRVESKDGQGSTQTVFPDGAKSIAGPGTTTAGELVQIEESQDAQGKVLKKRIKDREKTTEVLPEGEFNLEFAGEDPEGKPLTLVESYDEKGQIQGRDLVRPDGAKREGTDEWTIIRWYLDPENKRERVRARETYGLGGSVVKQEVLAREAVPPVPARRPPPTRSGPIVFTLPANMEDRMKAFSASTRGLRRAGAGQEDPETQTALENLEGLEAASRNFAGATQADYETARQQAAQYVIPLYDPPQKTELTWMKFKTARLVPPQPRLQEINTDLSKKYPLGLNGQEAIKWLPWKHAESDHFVVHFTELSTAAPVMDYIENAWCVVVQLLQVEEARGAAKSHVFVFPDQVQWGDWLGKHNLPSQVAGYAYKAELLFGAGQEKDEYVKTICHEATHAIVARYYPGRRLPLWLNEGMAEYAAAKAIALKRGQKIEKFLAPGALEHDLKPVFTRKSYGVATPAPKARSPFEQTFEPIRDPNAEIKEIDQLRKFYRTSERCVMTLNEKVDSANFPKFVNLLAAGNPADLALHLAYGKLCDSPEALAKLLAP